MSVVRRLSLRIRESFRRRRRPLITRTGDQKDRPVRKGCIRCKIALLDGNDLTIDVDKQSIGQDLVKKVLLNLDLVEKDYFGLQFMDTKQVPHWLDPTKKVRKQVKIGPPYTLHFRVKFYAAEPVDLHEELTRYQFFLQIKQDILRGKLKPTREQIVGIGAYAVQSELGDYDPTLHHGNYVSEFRLVPDQTEDLEKAIENKHRLLLSLTPADCETASLKIAKNLENYGIDLHQVSDDQGNEYRLGLAPRGIFIFNNNKQKIAQHAWPKITNISFKKQRFLLAVEKGQETEDHTFVLNSSRASKHLWKCAVEHHTFFRLVKVTAPVKRSKSLLSFSSKFRYSGRTLHQASKDDSVNARKAYKISRTRSERYAQRSTIGYIRVGSRVWARAVNGDYYRGQVNALGEKIYVKFDHEDTIAHDRHDKLAVVFDMDPDPLDIIVGTKVIAHWSGLSAYLPGVVVSIDGNKYNVHYNDGDKGNNTVQQLRILKPPLFFGPGSGSSSIQKRLSMKSTSLMGEGGRTSSSGADDKEPIKNENRQNGLTVSADIAPNTRKSSQKSTTKGATDSVFFAEFDSYSEETTSPERTKTRTNEYDSNRPPANRYGSNTGKHHPPPERSCTPPERSRSPPIKTHSPPDNDHIKYKVIQRTVKVGSPPSSRIPNNGHQQMIVTEL